MADEENSSCCTYPEAQALVGKSPRLALARAWDIDFVPFVMTISAAFTATGNPQPLLNVIPTKVTQRDFMIEEIDVDIQTKDAFPGDEFKPLSDWFYCYTSGIQTRIQIDGYNKRTTPYFPLGAIEKLCSPERPWAFLEEQQLSMDFTVTTALPSDSTVITVTYFGRTPCADQVFQMSSREAFNELDAMGYWTLAGRKTFGCT